MYEKVENCPICKATAFENTIICEDYTVSHESFALVKCLSCEFIFTNPRPDNSSLKNYYKSDNYISHTNNANNLINLIYKLVRNITLANKLKLINSLSTNRKLLDFGCGTGDFISHCKSNHWNVYGIEPNENARQIAQSKTSSDIFPNLKKLENNEKFGVITLWHVLEHIEELNKTIKRLKSLLDNDGYLITALPNCDSFDEKIYKEHWAAYDVPRHLYHFNQLTFNNLAQKHNLKIINTHPMIFDAYYVSLLSEKYKAGKSNFIKSFINGWKSNTWASKNNNNYSSLIYILRKK